MIIYIFFNENQFIKKAVNMHNFHAKIQKSAMMTKLFLISRRQKIFFPFWLPKTSLCMITLTFNVYLE